MSVTLPSGTGGWYRNHRAARRGFVQRDRTSSNSHRARAAPWSAPALPAMRHQDLRPLPIEQPPEGLVTMQELAPGPPASQLAPPPPLPPFGSGLRRQSTSSWSQMLADETPRPLLLLLVVASRRISWFKP